MTSTATVASITRFSTVHHVYQSPTSVVISGRDVEGVTVVELIVLSVPSSTVWVPASTARIVADVDAVARDIAAARFAAYRASLQLGRAPRRMERPRRDWLVAKRRRPRKRRNRERRRR